jgi:hypothetical protein
MNDLKTSIVIDLKGNLEGQSNRYSRAMFRFTRSAGNHIKTLRGELRDLGNSLSWMGNKTTALLGGVTAGYAAKQVMELEERYLRLGIQANKSNREMEKLKQTIFTTSQMPEFRVDPNKMLAAIAEIVEKTGDLEFAENNLRNIAAAIQATGAAGENIGGIMAEFQKMGITAPKDVLEAIDILNVQGKEGAFTLQNLAALGPRVVNAYTSLGRTGVPAIREMGAALQVAMQGTGEADTAATAFEATLRTLADPDKIKILKGAGIQLFEDEKVGRFRAINEIMTDIIKKTKGNKVLLGSVFDAQAVRAFNNAAGEFQRTGALPSLEKFYKVQADGTTTLLNAAEAAQSSNAALANIQSTAMRAADEMMAGPVKKLANKANDILQSRSTDTLLGNLGSDPAERRAEISIASEATRKQRERILQESRGQFSGQVKIIIDQQNRARVTKVTSDNKDVNISVDNGLQVGTQ